MACKMENEPYLQSVRLDMPAKVVIGTLGISPFILMLS